MTTVILSLLNMTICKLTFYQYHRKRKHKKPSLQFPVSYKLQTPPIHSNECAAYYFTFSKHLHFPFMSQRKLSSLRTYPSHLCSLCQIIFSMLLASLAHANTSSSPSPSNSFSASPFQILPTVFLLASVIFNVQVSAAYSATFQTVLFIICFLCSQSSFSVNDFFP